MGDLNDARIDELDDEAERRFKADENAREERLQMCLSLSPETKALLDRLAKDLEDHRSSVVKRALGLFDLVTSAQKGGKRMWVVGKAGEKVEVIVL